MEELVRRLEKTQVFLHGIEELICDDLREKTSLEEDWHIILNNNKITLDKLKETP